MRILIAAFALLAAACNNNAPYTSAVNLATSEVRPAVSPVPEGLYCLVSVSWREDGEPVSVSSGGADTCMRYSWDAQRRMVIAIGADTDDGEEPYRAEFALAPLGDGIFLMQSDDTSSVPERASIAPYTIALALIEGGAISAISSIGETPRRELARRFPAVILADLPDEGAGSYIKSGDRTYISAYLKDAALLGLTLPDDDGHFSVQTMLRVDAPDAESVFTILKRPDIVALKEKARSLARRAPQGIELSDPDESSSPEQAGH
jgi:hypothetical protein